MLEFNLLEQPLQLGDRLLIEASAGTGKTTTLENLILRLLLEGINTADGQNREVTLQEILVVTFTEAATAELIQRVRKNIAKALHLLHNGHNDLAQDSSIPAQILHDFFQKSELPPAEKLHIAQMRLRMALLSFDESSISTIHGFCSKMLSEFAFESGLRFDLELTEDETGYLEDTAHDYWRKCFYAPEKKFFASVASGAGITVNELCRTLQQLKSSPLVKLSGEVISLTDAEAKLHQAWSNLETACKHSETITMLENNAPNFTKAASGELLNLAKALDSNAFSDDQFVLLKSCSGIKPDKIRGAVRKRGVEWVGVKDVNPDKGCLPFDIEKILGILDSFDVIVKEYLAAIHFDFMKFALEDKALEKKKTSAGVQAFDDLLLGMFNAVGVKDEFCAKIRRRFPVVLIDEFQDTDSLQFQIFDRIFNAPEALMIMVGDPKQSIYQFRGADIYSYLQVSEQLPEEDRTTLSRNYRSSSELLEAFNTVFDLNNPFIEKSISYLPAEAGRTQDKLVIEGTDCTEKPLRILEIDSTDGKAVSKTEAYDISRRAICNEISAILTTAASRNEESISCARFEDGTGLYRPVQAKDIAVLTDTNYEAQEICSMLAERGIPAVLQNTGNIFEAESAADLLHIMSAIEQPRDPRRVLTALACEPFGLDYKKLYQLLNNSEKFEAWQKFFFNLLKIWQEHGFIRMFYDLLRPRSARGVECDIRAKLLSAPQGERRMTDLLHLGELLHKTALKKRLGPAAMISWLRRRITEPESGTENERRLESDEEAVKVMTAHKSKGLQFPLVFCTSLWKRGCLPTQNKKELDFFYHERDENGNFEQYFDFGVTGEHLKDHCQAYRREQLAESIRLIYVALTRAKNYCCFTWGNINKIQDSALAYLIGSYTDDELKILFAGQAPDTVRQLNKWRESGRIAFSQARHEVKNAAIERKQHQINEPPEFKPFVKDWGIMSFTALTAGAHVHADVRPGADDEPDNDVVEEVLISVSSQELPLGDFPGGPVSGDCIHQIFEKLDFSLTVNDGWRNRNDVKTLIEDRLTAMGRVEGVRGTEQFEQSLLKRRMQVCDMLENVLRCPLPGSDGSFRLCDLPTANHLPEMEFYFPVTERIDYQKINELIRMLGGQEGGLSQASDVQPLYGYMNGLIDLTFEQGGRYYIIDWKTNNLGASFGDFRQEDLAESMNESNYLLQAAIYMLALDKYLHTRLPGYDFNKHFGGVFYLYVRGMTAETADYGVYSMRPPKEVLTMLESIFPAHASEDKNG
ncbi:MAG: exodeoxyribonuclease V subunit beta [Lentisphaerae bacterium]|nr:exodeoxyribonuclease V subunit beta [Lentisphaerota bacterium]MCP4100208.1 exodeoxyribonuclease V subunit beta [Lentisphaerota bacterium]